MPVACISAESLVINFKARLQRPEACCKMPMTVVFESFISLACRHVVYTSKLPIYLADEDIALYLTA